MLKMEGNWGPKYCVESCPPLSLKNCQVSNKFALCEAAEIHGLSCAAPSNVLTNTLVLGSWLLQTFSSTIIIGNAGEDPGNPQNSARNSFLSEDIY